LPKFHTASHRLNDVKPDSTNAIDTRDKDEIQDQPSAEDLTRAPDPNERPHTPEAEDEMLFDTFDEQDLHLQPTVSPLRKRQKTEGENNSIMEASQHGATHAASTPYPKSASTSRFILKAPVSPDFNATPVRPSFITPAPTTEVFEASLPAIFSPHRKSQRFLPGGLAASMRDHIIEATSTHAYSSSKPSSEFRIRVSKARQLAGMSLIEGQTGNGVSMNLLLVSQSTAPQPGEIIQTKGMNWTIDVEQQMLVVVPDWKVEK